MDSASTTQLSSIYSKRFQALSRWVVLIVLWVIIFSIAIGKVGIANFMTLAGERDVLIRTVQELSKQNQEILENIHNLKNSRIFQERYLKQNFGYVEQDEIVFHFKQIDNIGSSS